MAFGLYSAQHTARLLVFDYFVLDGASLMDLPFGEQVQTILILLIALGSTTGWC